MATADKLITVAENVPKVYHAGQLNVIENTSTLKKNASGSAILIDDVSPVTHDMSVKISPIPQKNLLNRLIAKAYSSDIDVPTEDFINTYCSKKILFKQGTTYTFSIKSVSGFSGTVAWQPSFYIFDNGSLFISNATSPPVTFSTDFFTSDSNPNQYICYKNKALWTKNNMIQNLGPWSMTITPVKDFEAVFIVTDGNVTDSIIVTEAQIEEGSTATSYAPYIENPITDLTAVKVRKQGKNLIPYPFIYATFKHYGITFTDNKDGTITLNGQNNGSAVSNYNLFQSADKLSFLKPNTDYYLSCNLDNIFRSLRTVKSDGTYKYYSYGNINFPPDETPDRLFIQIKKTDTTTYDNTIVKLQIELGTTATDYEQYITTTEHIPTTDGTVNGVTSLYPNTTLTTDTDGVLIDCEYYKDIDVNDVIERTVTTYINPKIKIIGGYAFSNCTSLTSVDIPVATSISSYAFNNCTSLTSADFPAATNIGGYAFNNCTSLTTADIPVATSIGNSAFNNCTSLTTADIPVATSIGNSAFYGCSALTSVDFPAATNIYTYAFYGCSALTALILRNSTICALGNKNAFTGCTKITGTGGYIYVPSSLVNAYKTATNWVTYTSKFRALEDYTVDGTTTGALDESKVST